MLRDMEEFGSDLYQDGLCNKPPLTYEAYNAALKQHLLKFKNEIVDIEKKLMKQGAIKFLIESSDS